MTLGNSGDAGARWCPSLMFGNCVQPLLVRPRPALRIICPTATVRRARPRPRPRPHHVCGMPWISSEPLGSWADARRARSALVWIRICWRRHAPGSGSTTRRIFSRPPWRWRRGMMISGPGSSPAVPGCRRTSILGSERRRLAVDPGGKSPPALPRCWTPRSLSTPELANRAAGSKSRCSSWSGGAAPRLA